MVSDPHMRRLDVQPTAQMGRHPAPQKYINLLTRRTITSPVRARSGTGI
jgi:hypothetical protein